MAEERTMHVDVTSEMIGKYVFLPGSVERASLIAKHFDNPVKVAHKREYLSYTGTLDGVPVTVTSTGIGGPSTCIAIRRRSDSQRRCAYGGNGRPLPSL